MATFIDVLRRLGIFRSGATKATYTSAKDRPIELQQDDIYKAEKDTIPLSSRKEKQR